MLFVALAELVLLLAVVAALFLTTRDHGRLIERLEARHRQERYELQERIRAPELRPAPLAPRPRQQGDRERPSDLGALASIGTTRPLHQVPRADNEQGEIA